MLDLAKLTPLPWRVVTDVMGAGVIGPGAFDLSRTDADFIALARNAFDVMMRRGWSVRLDPKNDVWYVFGVGAGYFPDPFTALVEAERWWVENMEHEADA